MKNNPFVSRKLITIVATIFVLCIAAVAIIYAGKNKADAVAKSVLTKAYGAKLQDYEGLTNALTQSLEDKKILLDYMGSVYGEQLTENGCNAFLNKRITTAFTAHVENSDLKVSAMKLEMEYAIKGHKNYTYTIQVKAEKDASKEFTYKGRIKLIQENGQWKVDDASPIK